MASLTLKGIGKRFGPQAVLADVDLDVADGEFLVLVGPSGCGKSTLLRIIAGLEEASGGEIWIAGERAEDLPPQRRNIAMVFQSYALFPHMDARANIGFGPSIRGEPRAAISEKVTRAAGILGLEPILDRLPRQLSGGQRQRVAMGRSIVRDPALFLFDEPLSNLDAKLRVAMRTEIKALHLRLASTIVYVTHDQVEAMTLADRIVVMNAGRVEQTGTPLELYDKPVNRFVAGFLGSPAMTFIEGRLSRAADGATLVTDSGVRIPAPATQAAEGSTVELGIRPEDYRLADGPGTLPFRVQVVEPTGPETHLTGSIDDTTIRCVMRERLAVRPGDTIPLAIDPTRAHLFDAATGVRL